jgi:hypothetical protein
MYHSLAHGLPQIRTALRCHLSVPPRCTSRRCPYFGVRDTSPSVFGVQKISVPHFPFDVRCSVFGVRCSIFKKSAFKNSAFYPSVFDVRYSKISIPHFPFGVRRSMFGVRYSKIQHYPLRRSNLFSNRSSLQPPASFCHWL